MLRFALIAVALNACGPPVNPHNPGAPCTDELDECRSESTKIICDNGRWLEYPCDGVFEIGDGGVRTGGCGVGQQCIHPVPVAGDFCPASFEGQMSQRCLSRSAIAKCVGQKWTTCALGGDFCQDRVKGDDTVAASYTFSPPLECR